MKALVLAGGPGRRLFPISEEFPKPLVRIAGKPLVDYVIDSLRAIGIHSISVIVSNREVAEHIISSYGVEVDVIEQRGDSIEDAILSAKNVFEHEKYFLMAYGDIIAPIEMYRILLETYNASRLPVFSVVPLEEQETYGVAVIRDGKIHKIYEKPLEKVESVYVLAGAYILPGEVFELVDKQNSLTEALNTLVSAGTVRASLWTGDWVDIGYPWDIISAIYVIFSNLKTSNISTKAKISPEAVIEGPVIIEENAFIDHYAVIKGPAYIGREAFIGKGAFIREYSCVEEKAIVGAFCEIKRTSLQPEATVGSYTLVTDSVLGSGAVLEARVTILNKLPEDVKIARLPPLQGILRRYKKLGAYVAPSSRVRAGSVIGPAILVDRQGQLYDILQK